MQPRTAVIVQSNYIPWRGYFDLIRRADVFIVLDIVQYTKNDWRNRNRIKTRTGPAWLTVPVRHSLGAGTPIDAVEAQDPRWAVKHLKSLQQNYSRAACFDAAKAWLFPLFESLSGQPNLSAINTTLIGAIAARMGIATPIVACSELAPRADLLAQSATARLITLCQRAGATRYLSGPAARDYLDVALFDAAGIAVEWMRYDGYPEYPQLFGAFDPRLSVVDLVMNTGDRAGDYLGDV